jgi:hypothetical protein
MLSKSPTECCSADAEVSLEGAAQTVCGDFSTNVDNYVAIAR